MAMQLFLLLATPVALVVGQSNFANPVLWQDYAGNDVFYNDVDGYFYFSASNVQYSPGAPVLRSKDLVNWDGTWASTLRYRKSNKTWYWIGCIEQSKSYVYPVDDDDKMYVVYGNGDHYIAELSADGLSQVKTTRVFGQPPGQSGVEGNRLYKKDGTYYVLNDHPGDTTYVWKSASIYGSYSQPGRDAAGDWYFMPFTWICPGGRIPVLAPVTWGSDGYPSITRVGNGWGTSYAMPMPTVPIAAWLGTDNFTGPSLSPRWKWNHNPDPTKYSVNNGVTLRTATITDDIFSARNTLTHREHGPNPAATTELDTSSVTKSGNTLTLQNVTGYTMAQGTGVRRTNSTGTVAGSATLTDERGISYSVDSGKTFKGLGGSSALNTDCYWFQGQRRAGFNVATKALGGEVVLRSFTQTAQDK
ncbi:glycosyl hydrolase family 43 protein [Coniochaeta sp. 2T2.1]|nr:glycosyl hydrolase family 43 protein [Coniochaeta sp. 2T2.1]